MTDLARARAIHDSALAVPDADRERFVRDACAGDAALEALVLGILAQQDDHGTPTISPSGGAPGAPPDLGPDYALVRKVGEGGFGEVFLAEQLRPVHRRVALKVVKPGMDSKAVLARFEQERQALAVMDHPGIAKVFDAGVTPSGRPYFAMEYVEGAAITRHCDQGRLPVRQRLDLFAHVCDAVHHAHMKGVIHRDLKPSNILVTRTAEGGARAVVIDFGVAKAIEQRLTEESVFTEQGVLLGTPEYMSPEQAGLGAGDIDTRSDVYSLGVVLYELLTGLTPFDGRDLRRKGFAEMQRVIREVEPPRPSTRLSGVGGGESPVEIGDERTGAAAARGDGAGAIPGAPRASESEARTIAARRATDERALTQELRRELEWIPLKAMRKEREHRYRSAAELADDVRRYLSGQPLVAAPESRVYRARKFVRRNRVPVGAAAAVVVALAGGLLGTAYGLREARRQRDDAVEARKAEEIARNAEKQRADQLRQVSDFQSEMLRQIDTTTAGVELMADVRARYAAALAKSGVPEADLTSRVDTLRSELLRVNATDTAAAMIDRTILKPAIKTIDVRFTEQPLVDAQLRQAIAQLYQSIGLYEAALPLQVAALTTRHHELGAEHPDTLESISNMGFLLASQGKLAQAAPYYFEALAKRRRVLGAEHPDTLVSVGNVGWLLQAQGKLSESEPYHREAMESRRRVLGEDHPDTLTAVANWASLLVEQGKLTDAEPHYREVTRQRRRVLGDEHPDTAVSVSNLGYLLQLQGHNAEAEACYREALETRRRILGEDHPYTLGSIGNVGTILYFQGRLGEAETFWREALLKHRVVLGDEHPNTITLLSNFGALLKEQNKLAEAETCLREAVATNRRVLGSDHANTLGALNNLGSVLYDQGKLAEAEACYLESLDKFRAVFGEDHPDTLVSLRNLSSLLLSLGKTEDAERYCRESLETCRRVLGEEHPETLSALNAMGAMLRDMGRLSDAEPYYREALERRRLVLGNEHPDTVVSVNNLGSLLRYQGRFVEAEIALLEANETGRRVLGDEHPLTLNFINNLGDLLKAQGRLSEAEPYYREALEKRSRVLGEAHPSTIASLNNMGFLLRAQGRFDEAEKCYRDALDRARLAVGRDHPLTLNVMTNFGVLLNDQGRIAEAEPLLIEALESRRRVRGEEHPETLASLCNVGGLYRAQGKHKEVMDLLAPMEPAARRVLSSGNATQLATFLTVLARARVGLGWEDQPKGFELAEAGLLEAHQILVKSGGESRKGTVNCVQGLVDLYSAWHAAEGGKGYDAKAAEWRAALESVVSPSTASPEDRSTQTATDPR